MIKVKDCPTPNGTTEKTFFLSAFAADNQLGLTRDPGYTERLAKRDPTLAAAIGRGDWSVYAGQVFREFSRTTHVMQPFPLPLTWMRCRSLDWGYDAPLSVHWWAKDSVSGRLYVYRELYQAGLTDPKQARKVKDMTLPEEDIVFTFADPSCWTRRTIDEIEKSTYDVYLSYQVLLTKADNAQSNKLRKCHSVLDLAPDGKPYVQIFDTCPALIRTLQGLMTNPQHKDDILPGQEDHAYDDFAYGLTNYVEALPPAPKYTPAKTRSPFTR